MTITALGFCLYYTVITSAILRDWCETGSRAVYGVELRRQDGDSRVVAEWRAVPVECVWSTAALFPGRPAGVRNCRMGKKQSDVT